MSIGEPSVAAIVATYNRKELLAKCLDALGAQSRPVNRIIVMDCCSSDGTRELIERTDLANGVIDYVRLEENVGSAGAFHDGIQRAYEQNHDWFWIMDDDAIPEPDALEQLVRTEVIRNPQTGVLACFVLGTDGKPDERSRARWFDIRTFRSTTVAEGISGEAIECNSSTFVGMLVGRRAVERVGLPRKDFFIAHDDIEYIHRICAVGFRAYQVPRSKIVHLSAGISRSATQPNRKRCLPAPWRSYYEWRNSMYLRRENSSPIRFVRAAGRFAADTLLYGDRKVRRLSILLRAISDAKAGRLGRAAFPLE